MKRRLRISVVGAGRVGRTLARICLLAGYGVGDVVCASRRSAQSAVRFIGDGVPLTLEAPEMQAADAVLVATPDDRIEEAAEWISTRLPPRKGTVALHTSGAASSAGLALLARAGFAVGSCHPLQTFESPPRALQAIRGSYFCIEGEARAARFARALVRRIGGRSFEIPTAAKPLYHAAAVMASGGMTALFSVSLEALRYCGMHEATARRVLLPLSETTLANIGAVGTRRALTGPIRRGDAGTVRRNLAALADVRPEWEEVYRLLARLGLESVEQDLRSEAVCRLRELLADRAAVASGNKARIRP